MDIKLIATGLLILRLIATGFIVDVLRRQFRLMRAHSSKEIGVLRKVLMALAGVIFIGQFIPILIDTVSIFGGLPDRTPLAIGVAYAYSNAFTAAVAAILLWLIYTITERQNIELSSKDKRTKSDTTPL